MSFQATVFNSGPVQAGRDSSNENDTLVLIIDDDLAVRLMARKCLEKAGFIVEEADCAAEGLEKFDAVRPAVVLCDVVMPDNDGYYVCSQIRASDAGAHTPIIMLTGLNDIDSIEQAYAAGATEFQVKPINASLLPRSVRFIARASAALEQFRQSEERYALAARGANDGLWDWDIIDESVYYSERWKEILGEDEEIGTSIESWLNRIAPEHEDRVRMEIEAHLNGRSDHFESEYRILGSDDVHRWVLSRGMAIRNESGAAVRMAGSMTDISVRRDAQEQLKHDALHDSLTGLPNRNLFLDRLSHCIEISRRRQDFFNFAVLFLDLDRFKVVNDSMGHLTGDRMLIEIANRIRTTLRKGDTLARFGGDEFTVLLEDVMDVTMATHLAERLQVIISQPIELDGQDIVPSASIGIAMGGPGYQLPDEMLRDADVAMYRAKALGNGAVEVFNTSMRTHAVHALKTESELRSALVEKQFAPKYQPIVSLQTGEITGFEALVRWQHPTQGLVRPDQFLQVAEDSGLIMRIGREVLESACLQLAEWRTRWSHAQTWTVAVNVSSQELDKSDLVGSVDSVLADVGLPSRCLKLEITERSLIENDERAVAVLSELHERGVKLAIDDFGTGYSSLSYLHRFPFDDLKIDRSFIRDVEREKKRAELVKAIIQLGHNLDLSIIAEGVETAAAMEMLKEAGCECVQGNYVSRPIPPSELTSMFESEFNP